MLLSSLALGMVFAIISQTESQAVQYAMLALLAGLFFSGFILPIEGLSYPVKVISWLLPVTYGIAGLQDIMLRGQDAVAGDAGRTRAAGARLRCTGGDRVASSFAGQCCMSTVSTAGADRAAHDRRGRVSSSP